MNTLKPILYAIFGGVALLLCPPADWGAIAIGTAAGPTILAEVLLLLLGMLVITHGGDLFTDSAVAIARATRVPPVIIGGTLVSLATTFPEFMVSFTGAVNGTPDFAVGNALGSCCVNIGLIVGACAILNGFVARKRGLQPGIPINRVTVLGSGMFMLTAGVLVYGFTGFDNGGLLDDDRNPAVYAVSRWQAGVLFAVFFAYLGYSLRIAYISRFESRGTEEETGAEEIREHLGKQVLLFLAGAGLVVLGSRMLIANAEAVAVALCVPKLWIGLTVLAIGTSLPELTISVLSVVKQHGSLGLGNIIGANVLNICWVVASCAMWEPLRIRPQTVFLDGPIMLLLMVGLLVGAYRRERVTWKLGAGLLGVYLSWLVLIFTVFNQPTG